MTFEGLRLTEENQLMAVRPLLIAAFLIFTGPAVADELVPEPTQNPDAPYRLFKTQNIYTFLKLDTRTGQIWQVQWGNDDERFTSTLNPTVLVRGGRPGRFTLYPTQNIFTFILLDQKTGDTWHVQWGDFTDRFVLPIKKLSFNNMPPNQPLHPDASGGLTAAVVAGERRRYA